MPPKGKDISAMSARMASAASSTQQRAAPPPAAAPMTVPPPQSNVAPPAATAPGAGGVAMSGGRPKGKDLSRMGGGPPPPPPAGVPAPAVGHTSAPISGPPGAAPPVQVPVPAPTNMEQRHEIARRKAFGLDAANNPNMRPSPPMPYQSYSQSSQPLPQHRSLAPNASQPPQPIDIKIAKAKQPTKRPSHAESRLSRPIVAVTPTAKTTDDNYGNASLAPVIGEKLQKLCHSIDPSYTLDSEVQERLVEMADSFVDKVTKDAVRLARHRGSSSLDVVDIALALKKGYNISVPGLGPPSAARGLGQSVVAMSGVGSTAATGGQYGQYAGGKIEGGWLFADKVNAPAEGDNSKKRKRSVNTAAATSAAM